MIVCAEGLAEIEQVLSDHVMSFLTEPLRADELVPNVLLTLRRFSEMEKLKSELATAKSSLAEAKTCYLAKCRMMREYGLTEPEAHQRLQRMATDGRIRLAEAARRVLDEAQDHKRLPVGQPS
jgi:two-component system, response regulator / RNA-binding antiterminator